MTTREAVQLGVAILFPLSLLAVLLAGVARQHGRTRRQTVLAMVGIAGCLAGVVGTGLALNAWRGGPLFDFERGSFSLGSVRAGDILGLLVCAAFLVTALRISKWLAGGGNGDRSPDPGPSPPCDAGQAEEREGPG